MIEKRFEARIAEYDPKTPIDQELVLHEIMQQIVLASLASAGLFSRALFHGGTCLRLLYGTERFSEDLDFLLLETDPTFQWGPLLNQVHDDCRDQGIELEVQDRSRLDGAVKKAFLKTDSIGKLLVVELPHTRDRRRQIQIKLEIDTNPPVGSASEIRYLDFPVTVPVATQTLESNLALKMHALLCRTYTKGRDWWDFVWYLRRRITPTYDLLANALEQFGPWAGTRPCVDRAWCIEELRKRIDAIDWSIARNDIARFVPTSGQASLESWSTKFFRYQLERMADYMD